MSSEGDLVFFRATGRMEVEVGDWNEDRQRYEPNGKKIMVECVNNGLGAKDLEGIARVGPDGETPVLVHLECSVRSEEDAFAIHVVKHSYAWMKDRKDRLVERVNKLEEELTTAQLQLETQTDRATKAESKLSAAAGVRGAEAGEEFRQRLDATAKVLREVLMSEEFLREFAAAFASTPLPSTVVACPPTVGSESYLDNGKKQPSLQDFAEWLVYRVVIQNPPPCILRDGPRGCNHNTALDCGKTLVSDFLKSLE